MESPSDLEEVKTLSAPTRFPCSGIVLPNRLAKAAMEEMLGPLGGGDPTEPLFVLYKEWAKGTWGMILTGNVMVSPEHLGTPADVVVPFLEGGKSKYENSLEAYREWARAAHFGGSKTPVIMQLCHTGRQSARGGGRSVFQPALAPSAVPLNAGTGMLAKIFSRVMWGTPNEMTEKDIDRVVEGFVQGAQVANQTGFEGVQLHCSHGYLLAQFMSPNVNLRTDSYGGSPRARAKLLFRIIAAIRKDFPVDTGFCVGIKLNSSDYVLGGLTEQDALDNVKWIAEHGGVDFIEISGGTYENAAMLGEDKDSPFQSATPITPSARSVAREAFFISFASEAISLLRSIDPATLPTPPPLIMVTGGFRTRAGMAQAVSSHSTDIVGIGRPACADPALPITLLDATLPAARSPKYVVRGTSLFKLIPVGIILPGISTLFHTMLLSQIGHGEKPELHMSILEGCWRVWIRGTLARGWVWIVLTAALVFGVTHRV